MAVLEQDSSFANPKAQYYDEVGYQNAFPDWHLHKSWAQYFRPEHSYFCTLTKVQISLYAEGYLPTKPFVLSIHEANPLTKEPIDTVLATQQADYVVGQSVYDFVWSEPVSLRMDGDYALVATSENIGIDEWWVTHKFGWSVCFYNTFPPDPYPRGKQWAREISHPATTAPWFEEFGYRFKFQNWGVGGTIWTYPVPPFPPVRPDPWPDPEIPDPWWDPPDPPDPTTPPGPLPPYWTTGGGSYQKNLVVAGNQKIYYESHTANTVRYTV